MSPPTPLDVLARARYLLLSTTRGDGTVVPTPAWVVRDDDRLYVWTAGTSGEARRIRYTPQVAVAPCAMRGKPHGASVPAVAVLHEDAAAVRHVRQLVIAKYGLRAKALMIRSRRHDDAGVAVEIRLVGPADASPTGPAAPAGVAPNGSSTPGPDPAGTPEQA